MRSYISYIIDGIWEAKQCILLGMILWLLWNLILFSLKKRNGERLKKYGFKYLFCELLLVIYLCTILTITGIIRTNNLHLCILGSEYDFTFKYSI